VIGRKDRAECVTKRALSSLFNTYTHREHSGVLTHLTRLTHSGVHYNQSDVEELRAKCQEWKDGFLAHSGSAYSAYLAEPEEGKLYERNKLSRYLGAAPLESRH